MLRLERLVKALKIAAEFGGGFQTAQGRLVTEVNLAVALVRGDHETVPVGQGKQLFPFRQGHHRACGVARRADKHQLRTRPDVCRHAVPVRGKVACRIAGHKVRRGASQQGRAFVDLVEGVGAEHRGPGAGRIDHGLGQREQRLARAQHRQHLGGGVQLQPVAAFDPGRTGLAQGRFTGGAGVTGQTGGQRIAQGILNESGGGVFGFADAQADVAQAGVGGDTGKEQTQPLKGVRLQLGKKGIHPRNYRGIRHKAPV